MNKDWQRADIIAAIKKRKKSLRSLSLEAGLAQDTLRNALERKWPKGERIIAHALGIPPEIIWPSRYNKK